MTSTNFWRPSSSIKGLDRDASSEGTVLTFNKNHSLSLAQQRERLPIYQYRDAILYLLEKFSCMVLVGGKFVPSSSSFCFSQMTVGWWIETGCGKSTQIPQFLMEAGWAKDGLGIVCTQPRKVAVLTVSERVANEVGCRLGDEVGYGMRFDFRCTDKTRVRFYTDGVLLRETLSDPLLSRYSVIIVDEAHQRSIQSDILLGLLKKIRRKRPDLRVVVTSATIDAVAMKNFMENNTGTDGADDTCILSVHGRSHPVDVCYLAEPCRDFVLKMVETICLIHRYEDHGDILAFLPGVDEIEKVIKALNTAIDDDIAHSNQSKQASSLQSLYCLPLHSSLSHHQQLQVFSRTPSGRRKVVVATNAAETSLTIEGVKFVVDCCLVRQPYHDVRSGLTLLGTSAETQFMATQRAGRAGRTQPGKCFRLVTEDYFAQLVVSATASNSPSAAAEMARCDITTAILTLKALGIEDILHFDFLTPPSPASVIFALEQLFSLGAMDLDGKLTVRGLQMAELPAEPRWARCLLASRSPVFDVQEEMLSIAAICTLESPFVFPFNAPSSTMGGSTASKEDREKKMRARDAFVVPGSDHATLLNVFQRYREEIVQRRASDSAAHAWCEEHGVLVRIMKRAEDVRRGLVLALRRLPVLDESLPTVHHIDPTNAGNNTTSKRLRRCLLAGFFANCARLTPDGRYRTIRGGVPLLPLPTTSVLASFGAPPEWIVFGEVSSASLTQNSSQSLSQPSGERVWVRDASAIEPLWLTELAPHYYDLKF